MDNPLNVDSYHGKSGSLHEELVARFSYNGLIYKYHNTSGYMKIKKEAKGTSVESTVKEFYHHKDMRGAFIALILNHAGNNKYLAILKKGMKLPQIIKWNGRSYPLETKFSNHCQAVEDLQKHATHITTSVPYQAQRDLISY